MNLGISIASLKDYARSLNNLAQRFSGPLEKVDLMKDIPQMMVIKHGIRANLKVIKTEDEMLGALLDLKG